MTTITTADPLTLRIGRRSYSIASYAEASGMVEAARDRSGVGGSGFPACLIYRGEELVAHVSYNGRVWPGRYWRPGDEPLFDNQAGGAS